MTPVAETMLALADKCEAATGPDRELDATIHAYLDGYTAIEERDGWIVAVGKGNMERSLGLIDPGKHGRNFTPQHHDTPAYTASVDAAMSLVPEGFVWGVGPWGNPDIDGPWAWCATKDASELNDLDYANGATPALALTAACLRARAAKAGQ